MPRKPVNCRFRFHRVAAALVAAAAALPAAAEPAAEPDLPPAGTRSTFDFIFTRPEGAGYVYDVPPSIEGVIGRLRSLGAGEPIALLMPMGRSVQRLNTDLKEPRVLVTLPAESHHPEQGLLPVQVKGRLFIGFGARTDSLEVISWNEGAARFEFQLVKHLSDPARQEVIYAPRAFCGTCHFHREPMFPRNPWEETTAFPATARAVERARESQAPYHGIPIAQPNNNSYEFDRLTDAGADMLTWQRLWKTGCDGGDAPTPAGIECRALVLKLAFRSMFDFWVPTESAPYARLQTLWLAGAKAVYGTEIPFPLADLETRNPLTQDGGFTPGEVAGAPSGTGSGDLQEIRKRSSVPAEFDPLSADPAKEDPLMHHPTRTPGPSSYKYPKYQAILDRPKIRRTEAPATLNEFIEWAGSELLVDYAFWSRLYDASATEPYGRLDGAIDKLAAEAQANNGVDAALLRLETFSPSRLAAAASRAASLPEVKACCRHAGALPPARADQSSDLATGDGLKPEEKAVAQKLTEFCWPCHRPSAGELGFFTGDFAKVDTELARRILTRLDWETCVPDGTNMPPKGAKRKAVCDRPDDRRRIIDVLRTRYFPGVSQPCGPANTATAEAAWNSLCLTP